MLTPGSKIGGFLIGDLLGKGAMGEVYKGEQLSLKRPVAVKRIAGHLLENEDMVRRFKREAQVLAKVGHPNVVGVIDCEEFLDAAGEKHLLLIMELIEGGRSLKAHLGKPIDWRLATSVIRMCAEGLAAAYEQQVVHRDIKPDNIMMTRKGIAKLVDFGLAKATESTALTMQAAPMGTPLFMSPEACRGEEVGHAGDLYSLGVSWWYMLVGTYPFDAANLHGLLYKHISEPLPPPTGLFDHVPAPIVALVYQCLEKDPAKRHGSAIKLVEAIESLPGQGLLMPRDARELIGAGDSRTHVAGGTTGATAVAGKVDRSAATLISGTAATAKANDATAATALAQNHMTIGADLSPKGAVAATVVTNLGPQTATTAAPAAPAGKGGLIIGAIVVVLALGGVGAWFATRPGAPAPPAQPTTTEHPATVSVPPVEPAKPAEPAKPTDSHAAVVATVPIVPPSAPPVVTEPVTPPKPQTAAEPPKPVAEATKPDPQPDPPKPVVEAVKPVEPPKPAAATETAKPVELPKPPEAPKAIDTEGFDSALAGKDWKAAKAASDALPEPARAESATRLAKAANSRLVATMKAAKVQYDAQQFQEAFATLAADVPVTAYADKPIRDQFVKLANLVRDTAKQAQEQP